MENSSRGYLKTFKYNEVQSKIVNGDNNGFRRDPE